MNQIVCDRCARVVPKAAEGKVREIALVEREAGKMTDLGDFCPKCLRSLKDWLNRRGTGRTPDDLPHSEGK